MSGMDNDGDVNMTHRPDPDRIMDHISYKVDVVLDKIRESAIDVVTELRHPPAEIQGSLQTAITQAPNQPCGVQTPPDPSSQEYIQLQDSYQVSESKRGSLEDDLRLKKSQIKELEAALQKSMNECQKLHSIIHKTATPNTGPSDDQIEIEFSDIGTSILKICRTYYQAPSIRFPLLRKDSNSLSLVERQQDWLSPWNGMNLELRNYTTQGCIFSILNKVLFTKEVYGLDPEMEDQLSKFEFEAYRCKEIPLSDCAEWRRRTVTAAKLFKDQYQISREAADKRGSRPESWADERAAKKIYETLELALTRSPRLTPPPKLEQLKKELLALCSRALQLALTLRSSKANFQVVVPRLGTQIAAEDAEMELVAVEGPMSSSNLNTVAFTVFGGLQKSSVSPADIGDPPRILKKADVVGRAV